jgi:glycosyltransferase involved in cell wall biosynthesis
LIAQTVLAVDWVVVDDGSVDGTAAYIESLNRKHPWVTLVRGGGTGPIEHGRMTGRDVVAFERGLAALHVQPDVVLKLDADVSVLPDFFERLLEEFERDPILGIAGGACYELDHGAWRERHVTGAHVRGATRAYRWQCLQDVLPLERRLGWDGIDEIIASCLGWRTKSVRSLPFFHHRRVGERDGARRSYADQGATARYLGYRVSYLILRSLFQSARHPAAIAMAGGYLRAAARREPTIADQRVRRHLREQQRLRVLPRRAAEAFGRRSA